MALEEEQNCLVVLNELLCRPGFIGADALGFVGDSFARQELHYRR
jgi:hypothetical protein